MDILSYFRIQTEARKRRLRKLEQRKMPPSPNSDTTESIADLLERVSHQSLRLPSASQEQAEEVAQR